MNLQASNYGQTPQEQRMTHMSSVKSCGNVVYLNSMPRSLPNFRAIMPKYDARGNKKGKGGRFFALQHQMMNSKAWQSLTPQEVAVFLRVAYRFHGANNGELALSARDAAKEANVSKTTACKALQSLCEKGLLKLVVKGGYSTNGGKATTYALTCLPIKKGKPASREYQNWEPSNKNKSQYQMRDSVVPIRGTEPKIRLVK